MTPFELQLRTRLVFGPGVIDRLGGVARELGFSRPLLVTDRGLRDAGHVERVLGQLRDAGVEAAVFDACEVNPDAAMVDRGAAFAAARRPDSIIGLGGGSPLDCAKGINLIFTNGGAIADYKGYGLARKPLLPMIAVPTTAGTGSEAQSYAVIADSATHMKMACGDPKLAFAAAILDPGLTVSQPPAVTAAAGFDALAHAVETAVTTRRTPVSTLFSHAAFRLLDGHYERTLADPEDIDARAAMQLGAFYAGVAIEHSMLGAAHACANPLTARHALTHGVALAIVLPHVVRWNAEGDAGLYGDLAGGSAPSAGGGSAGGAASRHAHETRGVGAPPAGGGSAGGAGDRLAGRLAEAARSGGFPPDLRTAGVPADDLPSLADAAAAQWTGTFNPRPFGAREALDVYQRAW